MAYLKASGRVGVDSRKRCSERAFAVVVHKAGLASVVAQGGRGLVFLAVAPVLYCHLVAGAEARYGLLHLGGVEGVATVESHHDVARLETGLAGCRAVENLGHVDAGNSALDFLLGH